MKLKEDNQPSQVLVIASCIRFEVFAQAHLVFAPLDLSIKELDQFKTRIAGIFDTAYIVNIEQMEIDTETFRKHHYLIGNPKKAEQ